MTPLLEIERLKKHFPVYKGVVLRRVTGYVQAVDDISFTVDEGQTFSLVGESGCGKTTTAKVTLLLEPATSGRVLFEGTDILNAKGELLARYRRLVQTVFQDPYSSLEPRMRMGPIVEEPLLNDQAMSRDDRRRRVAEVLELVGLSTSVVTLFPHEFSGGQRQRIAIARALASRPRLIVLDEPVSSLDVSIRAQISNTLKDIQDELGISYLLIAHDLATVRYMSHQIGVMYLGKLVERSSAQDLFAQPLHPYTKALLAAALPSDPDLVSDEVELQGEVPSPLNPPSGCRFHPRCPVAMDHCSRIEPEFVEHSPDHWVACHLYPATLP